MPTALTGDAIERALRLLDGLLTADGRGKYWLVVCGGAALRLTGLHDRTTKDVDIVALMDPAAGELISPAPLPGPLLEAAALVAKELQLPPDWLNNEPSSRDGGLFQFGLPQGLVERLTTRVYGASLTVSFIGRLDQIHLKLYAAIDQPNSYHTADLRHLKPTEAEIEAAIRWARTHDPSEGFKIVAASFLRYLGFPYVAERL